MNYDPNVQDPSIVSARTVCVICTGGTFDKIYEPIQEKLVFSERSAVETILSSAQVDTIVLKILLRKDSLDLTNEDVAAIRAEIAATAEKAVVVVHGTSRMVESASRISDATDKTIVFTGAMVPASIDSQEASFNLGVALALARHLAPGVWIAMNRIAHRPSQVLKNVALGRFERASPN